MKTTTTLAATTRFRPIHLLLCSVIMLGIGFNAGLMTTNGGLLAMITEQAGTKAADDLQEYYKWKAEQEQQRTPPPPPPPPPGAHHEQQEQQCQNTLNKLDAIFDERRNIRIRKGAATRRPPDQVHFWDLFEPEAICFTEERFGSMTRYDAFGDGPKFACGIDYLRETTTRTTTSITTTTTPPSSSSCLVYSVGSNNDIFFEQAVSTYLPGCEIHTFDPTLTKPFIGDAYSTFHPWGIGKENGTITFGKQTFPTKSFEQIIHDLNHIGRRINILKIDCEGCEYQSMIPLFELIAINNNKVEIDQILIELHNEPFFVGTPAERWTGIRNWFDAADRAKMRIYHKERNGWGLVPGCCVEYAFASEDFLRRSNAQIVCGGSGGVVG